MNPILIKSKFITKMASWVISVYAITLFPFIVSSEDFEQQKELYLVGFYFLYVYDYLKGVVKYKDKEEAYRKIRFEQEAYSNEDDLGYIQTRDRNNWKKYSV